MGSSFTVLDVWVDGICCSKFFEADRNVVCGVSPRVSGAYRNRTSV